MPTQKQQTVGALLKELRLSRLLTQKQLARELDVDQMTISRWERDDVPPSDLNRVRLGQFFDVHPDTFRVQAAA